MAFGTALVLVLGRVRAARVSLQESSKLGSSQLVS